MLRTEDSLRKVIEEVLSFLKKTLDIKAAVLFGSYASGSPKEHHDIDLAVFYSNPSKSASSGKPDMPLSLEERARLAAQVRLNCGMDVDLYLFPTRALEEARHSNLCGFILKTGKLVYKESSSTQLPFKLMTCMKEEILRRLRRYQAEMLKETYHDLMEEACYRKLLSFILDTVYSSEELHGPTQAFKKMADYFISKAKSQALLSQLLELNRLSEDLDGCIVERLCEWGEIGEITPELYERALRAYNNLEERQHHIELFGQCMTSLHDMVHHPLASFMIRPLKILLSYLGHPAKLKAMEEGYEALSGIEDISRFIQVVKERETERLKRIYEGIDRQL